MVNYDVVNDRMLAKEDILRMTWVNSSMYHQDLMQLLVNGAEVDLETANVPDSIDINQWPKAVAVGENLVFADLGFKLPDTDYDVLSTFTFGGLEEFLKNGFLKRLKRPATENTPQQLEEPQPLSEDLRIYSQVDSMPHYIGGDKELFKFISSNLVYPPLDLHLGISGKVVLSYIIEKDGTLSNIAVISPVSPRIDREAVRVLRLSHKWEPAMVAGKPVRMRSTIPVSFLIKAPRVATVITQ
jgi:TonB family protein